MVTYLSIASDSKVLDDGKSEKQRYDPSAVIDILYTRPIVYDLLGLELTKQGQDHSYIASCRNLEREYSEPSNAVFPSAGKSPRRVNEPANVHGKCSINRVHDRQFGKCLHHQVSKHKSSEYFHDGLRIRDSLHHATYCEPIRFVNKSWIVRHSPMIIKPMSTAPGPPV